MKTLSIHTFLPGFGECSTTGSDYLNDIWVWDMKRWINPFKGGEEHMMQRDTPKARVAHTVTPLPDSHHHVLLYGGSQRGYGTKQYKLYEVHY